MILDGYKSYIVAVLLGLLAVAQHLVWVTPETAAVLTTLLLGGGIAALRHAK